ncbi:hypothetical protein IBT49_04745 [Erwinia sp. S63]|uniref:hypothetical protein n=1 Tax=Erwinia sp. S63 TaxID=2769341 RepID=UPI00190C894F|nr:hypothetical protein [Erwinia sp. S63]MBK0095272.1 hypothetical protein [Erwinia sp. S63]
MNRLFLLVIVSLLSFSTNANTSKPAESFVSEVKKAIESDGKIQQSIEVSCPAPSASGTFLLTKATYDFGKSLGVYVFKEGKGPDAKLDWIGAKTKGDDFSSDEIEGFEFGFTMPNGQFFLNVNKFGKVKAGLNVNGTSGVKEISCKLITNS